MNLRLDEALRIRLNMNEYVELSKGATLEQEYSLGECIRFRLSLSSGAKSGFESDLHGIKLQICQSDMASLVASETQKRGVEVKGVIVQVDRFDKGRTQ